MKKILIIGAGLSATSMIEYLLKNSTTYDWKIVVGDMSEELARKKINNHPNGKAIRFDINDEKIRETEIQNADLVVSFLPAFMHPIVASDCVRFKKDMVTASYVSQQMKDLDEEAKKNGIILMNEIGVDPGIDHMSAMKVIDKIKAEGGKMLTFKSNTGGLVAPKYDNNPWNYKFTWNPRNVVLAGQGTAQYIENERYVYIPYNRLFTNAERVNVLQVGEFEVYPNRDSLKYRSLYGLENIPTMVRGTMRRPGYCKAWNVFVQLGITDNSYIVENSENLTYRDFISAYLPGNQNECVQKRLRNLFGFSEDSNTMYRLRWLGIFDNKKIGLKDATPAQILQKILEEKWTLDEGDIDMIVMQHIFEYELNNKKKRITSSLVVEGKDNMNTAMAMTVGIPAAIATKLILTGVITAKGVQVPTTKDIYEPVLNELEEYGICFVEEEIDI